MTAAAVVETSGTPRTFLCKPRKVAGAEVTTTNITTIAVLMIMTVGWRDMGAATRRTIVSISSSSLPHTAKRWFQFRSWIQPPDAAGAATVGVGVALATIHATVVRRHRRRHRRSCCTNRHPRLTAAREWPRFAPDNRPPKSPIAPGPRTSDAVGATPSGSPLSPTRGR